MSLHQLKLGQEMEIYLFLHIKYKRQEEAYIKEFFFHKLHVE
jgi:hypothetical protein